MKKYSYLMGIGILCCIFSVSCSKDGALRAIPIKQLLKETEIPEPLKPKTFFML